MARDGSAPARGGLLHQVFRWGVIAKGVYGLAEVLVGVFIAVVGPIALQQWTDLLAQQQLLQDPDSSLALWIIHLANGLTVSAVVFASAYLIVHGIVKIGLLLAVATRRYRVYPWAIAVLVSFIGYQSYELVVHYSVGLLALTVFDAAIVLLTWREYRRRPAHGPEASPSDERPAETPVLESAG
jgi:uncharacterized membrane protein